MLDRIALLKNNFDKLFGSGPSAIVRAPGRGDLLGSHTDYNEGFVLPVAVDLDTVAAGRLRDDNKIAVYSANIEELVEFEMDSIACDQVNPWSNYVRGVVMCLRDA